MLHPYNIEAMHNNRRNLNAICFLLYAAILASFVLGYYSTGSYHIGAWLYLMLFFYTVSTIYCVWMIIREMHRRRRMLETMSASDMLPYVQYSTAE